VQSRKQVGWPVTDIGNLNSEPSSFAPPSNWPTTWACASPPKACRIKKRDILVILDYDHAQGFHLCKPLSSDDLLDWLTFQQPGDFALESPPRLPVKTCPPVAQRSDASPA
jgi:hypothetical protein